VGKPALAGVPTAILKVIKADSTGVGFYVVERRDSDFEG
jgi:hypothetical protein